VNAPTRWLVIGGGTAGCVVAGRLSEDPSNEVVLLEGGADHGPGPVPDRGGVYLEDQTRMAPDVNVVRRPGRSPEPYAQGYGLGGSTLIHGALASLDPGTFEFEHLVPLEQAGRLGTLGAALLEADPRARPALLARREGQRVTVADAYLRPALHRQNLMVVTNSPVVRLGLSGWKVDRAVTAQGIEYRADRFVLCAGAIGTPTLLLRSHLDTPGIGEGIQDHPACTISLDLEPGTDVAAPMISVLVDRHDSQIIALNHLYHAPGHGALMAGQMQVTSAGRVSLPDPDGPPLVELNQLSTAADVAGLTDVVHDALRLARSEGLAGVVRAAYIDDHGTPASSLGDDLELISAWAATHLTGFHHLSSSCREGVVADPSGRVLGYDNLMICDASLFPKAPPRNPFMPIVQLAERLTRQWMQYGR
jgi:choline dehydrogenase/5-(hydroxymethyl)furfural/furfural oxidase